MENKFIETSMENGKLGTNNIIKTAQKLIKNGCYSSWTWANCDDYHCPIKNSEEWFKIMTCSNQNIELYEI